MLLLNKLNISKLNLKNFSDKNGVFVYYSNQQICRHLRCNHKTATDTLKNLQQAGLIRKEYQKNGLPLKIYVNDVFCMHQNTYKPKNQQPQKPPQAFNSRTPAPTKEVSFNADISSEQKAYYRKNFGDLKNPKKQNNGT